MTTPTTNMQSQKTTFMSQSSTHSVFTEPSTTIQISESQTTTPKKNVDEMTTSKEKSTYQTFATELKYIPSIQNGFMNFKMIFDYAFQLQTVVLIIFHFL